MRDSLRRRLRSRAYWALIGVLGLACSEPGGEADGDSGRARPLCDGSDGVRLRVNLRPAFAEGLEPFTHPNGNRFIEITGACDFFVSGSAWGMTKTGTLGDELVERVEHDLNFAELASTSGTWSTADCYDPPLLELGAGSKVVRCFCGCKERSTPAAVRDAVSKVESIVDVLAEQGAYWSGPMSLIAVRNSNIDDEVDTQARWPLDVPLSTFAFESGSELSDDGVLREDALDGFLIEETEDVAALRAMILEYAQDFEPPTAALPVRDDEGRAYELYGRDELDR